MDNVLGEVIWTLGGVTFVGQQLVNILIGFLLAGVMYKHRVRRIDAESIRWRVGNLERHVQELMTLFRWSLTASDEDKEKLFLSETFKWRR